MHPTPRTALNDALQSLRGPFAESGRIIGDDQHPIWLRDFTRLLVELLDRPEFIFQILLKHVFHVFGQIRQLLLDL